MSHNLSDSVLVKQTLAPQSIAGGAVINGSSVDCAGYEQLLAHVELGAIASAANTSLSVKLQESADNSTFTDVNGAATAAILNAGQNAPYLLAVNLSERKRYLRAVVTAGSAGGGLLSASFELSAGRHLPPTQDKPVVLV